MKQKTDSVEETELQITQQIAKQNFFAQTGKWYACRKCGKRLSNDTRHQSHKFLNEKMQEHYNLFHNR